MLDKFEIARCLREIGTLLELKGENSFKCKAYHNGAEAIESMTQDLGPYVDEKRLTEIRNIGAALAAKVAELYLTGRCEMLENLRSEMPPGVIELSNVPGLSTKKIQALHSALGIISIAELQAACKAGLVSKVPGFGLKTEQKLLEGIQTYENREERILLLEARKIAKRLIEHMGPDAQAQVAGSVRRWQETAGNINLVASAVPGETEAVLETFEAYPVVTKVSRQSAQATQVRLASGIKADLIVAQPGELAAALIARTGSHAHFERLQKLAREKNLELTEHGLYQGQKKLDLSGETELYERLGLTFIPPELREDIGEIEMAAAGDTFADLIEKEDIQGMVHCHTTYSDGRASVEEMARAAEALGMKYITITDHSPAAHYAGGVEPDRLKKQWEEIDRVQEKVKIKLLRGTESDILEDGALDYPDAILEKFDVVIASIHSRMKMDEDQMTRRLVNCMKQPYFKIWGHALGRLVLRREPFKCRIEEILDAARESNVAIEINGDPYRLDMEPRWAREAKKRGLKFVISTDAHSVNDMYNLPYGIHMARRAGLRKADVLNALPAPQFAAGVRPATR